MACHVNLALGQLPIIQSLVEMLSWPASQVDRPKGQQRYIICKPLEECHGQRHYSPLWL